MNGLLECCDVKLGLSVKRFGSGNAYEVLQRFNVKLSKKHSRGRVMTAAVCSHSDGRTFKHVDKGNDLFTYRL